MYHHIGDKMKEKPSSSPNDETSRSTPGPTRAAFPLRLKLALLSALLATIPLGVVGALLVYVFAGSVSILSREIQAAVVEDLARTIDQEFVEAQDGLDAVGRVLTNAGLSADVSVPLALSIVEGHETLDSVGIYGADGQLIDVIREQGDRAITITEELPLELRREAEQWNAATGLAVSMEGQTRVPLVIPLRVEGRVTGYVMSPVSLEGVQNRVARIAGGRFPNVPDSIFVVDQRLRVLAHSDRRRATTLESAADEGILDSIDEQTLRADYSRSGQFTASDGTPMVGSVVALSGRRWAVVVQIPESVAYATRNQMTLVVLITVAVAILLALIAGIIIARRITAPLGELTAFAGHLSARRFDQTVKVETSDELSLLGEAMIKASADLAASEEKLKKEAAIRADLGRYLPEKLVDKVVRREQDMSLGGERRTVTILFADVVAFTPLTEQLKPEDVVTILNELFTILTGIVFRHSGTVDKFIGDCVMALWGAPTAQDDHAEQALSAAEDMMQWLEMGNATWKERFDVTVHLAIGVHSGEAVVGNIGSKSRMEYTAIGSAVNVAAHLENIARPHQILVSQSTRDIAGSGFEYVDAGTHTPPGSSESLQLFEVRV